MKILLICCSAVVVLVLLGYGAGSRPIWNLLWWFYTPVGNKLMDWFPNTDEPLPVPLDVMGPKIDGMSEREARAWWWWRNPFADLFKYRLGIVGEDHVDTVCDGYDHAWDTEMWRPGGGWLCAKRIRVGPLRWWEFRRLPWWSYEKGKFQFYFGWKPNGAFGAKLRRKRGRN